ncbi:MAG TPA: hypothetical protein VFK18_00620, partial [Luteimonas sp.]|nr:hypothetical protein [Luteimonas sp.]
MKILHATSLSLALAAVLALPACSRPDPGDAAKATAEADEARGVIAKAIDKEISKARKELREGNLVISGDRHVNVSVGGWKISSDKTSGDDRPRAEITPTGDLLIAGKAVDVTPDQRRMLLQYREEVLGVAEAGLEIGSKGADLAGEAIGQAIGAIFSGNTDEIEQRVEARAQELKEEAKVICT